MNIRRLPLITFLGLSTLLCGAYVSKAQTIVFEPGNYRLNHGRYRTNERGANLLREAVRRGYQEGYQAGRDDRDGRRRMNYRRNSFYTSGNSGWESYVDRRQYQYYYQQGFQRGYQDGFGNRQQYGVNSNGQASLLTSILGTILSLQPIR